MSHNLALAQQVAFDLATTLMVCVVLFKGDLGYGVLPSAEYDGDPDRVIHEYDPYC